MKKTGPKRQDKFIQISTTTDTKQDANRIAHKLLNEKVAACVQVLGPISSTYRWKRKIERSSEWLCLIKARRKDYGRVESIIRKIHPYELPEVLGVPILDGSRDYLGWMTKETTRRQDSKQI